MKLSHILGGLAGACALTLINQSVARFDKKAPRLDLWGMNAAAKVFNKAGVLPSVVTSLFPMSIAGDLVSNSLYYSLAATNSRGGTLAKGLLLGVGAGLGAVTLPNSLGLNSAPTNLTQRTKLMTIAYYAIGGLIAAATINSLGKNSSGVDQAKAKLIPA